MITISKEISGASEAALLEVFGTIEKVQAYYEDVLNNSIRHITKAHLKEKIQAEVDGDLNVTNLQAHKAAIAEIETATAKPEPEPKVVEEIPE